MQLETQRFIAWCLVAGGSIVAALAGLWLNMISAQIAARNNKASETIPAVSVGSTNQSGGATGQSVNIGVQNNTLVLPPAIPAARPLVTLTPEKYQDGKFLKMTMHGNAVEFKMQFAINNIGSGTTRMIRLLPDRFKLERAPGQPSVPSRIELGTEGIALAPGSKYIFETRSVLTWKTEAEAKQEYETMLARPDDPNSEIPVKLAIHYGSPEEPTKTYHTVGEYRFRFDRVLVVKVDYPEDFPGMLSRKVDPGSERAGPQALLESD